MNNTQRRQRRYAVFAIFMAVLMGATAILPSIAPNTSIQQAIQPTSTIIPTFPAPPTDLSAITFDKTYLHTSGLYLVNYPEGWEPLRGTSSSTYVQINFENAAAQTVIENYVEFPDPAVSTLQEVSARYNENTLRAGWNRYNSWQETNRTLDTAANAVVIDFELTLRGQVFLARHHAELRDDGRIYVTRVVAPQNARALLLDLLEKARASVRTIDIFEGSPVTWDAYYSDRDNLILRHPKTWVLRDGAAGQPVTFENGSASALRVETAAGSVADEAAAEAFVLAQRPDAEVRTVQGVERNGSTGFEVSYVYRTLEGEPQSALAVILPDGEDTLRVATVRVANLDADLLGSSVQNVIASEAVQIAGSFNLATGLGLPVATEAE